MKTDIALVLPYRRSQTSTAVRKTNAAFFRSALRNQNRSPFLRKPRRSIGAREVA